MHVHMYVRLVWCKATLLRIFSQTEIFSTQNLFLDVASHASSPESGGGIITIIELSDWILIICDVMLLLMWCCACNREPETTKFWKKIFSNLKNIGEKCTWILSFILFLFNWQLTQQHLQYWNSVRNSRICENPVIAARTDWPEAGPDEVIIFRLNSVDQLPVIFPAKSGCFWLNFSNVSAAVSTAN